MSDTQQQPRVISQELTDELAETAATLTRLGVTLAGLPAAMMPDEQRKQFRQVTNEVFRFGAMIPSTVTALLRDAADEEPRKPRREDLGSRLRRERREQERAASRAAYAASTEAGEEEATEEVEEDVQDAWNDPPLEPGERTGHPADAPEPPEESGNEA